MALRRSIGIVIWALTCTQGCAIIDAVQTVAAFAVRGTLVGLHNGNGVTLQNVGKALTLSQNGSFAFPQKLSNRAAYAVTVAQQPNGQFCEVTGASGIINRNDAAVAVTCYDGSGPGPGDGTGAGPGNANNSALTFTVSSDSPAVADGEDAAEVTVVLRDRANAPVSGRLVAVSSDGAALTIAPSSGMSDNTGVFVARIRTTVAQAALVRVQVAGVTQTLAVVFGAGPAVAAHTTFVANPNAVQANGAAASVLTVRAADAFNNPTPQQTVTFSNSDSAHPPSPVSAVTGADGVATATLTSVSVGQQTVSTTVAGIVLQGTVRFTGPPDPAHCTFSAGPTSLLANGTAGSSLQLVVRDSAGSVIGGQPVRVSLTGRGNHLTVANANTLGDGTFASTLSSTHAETKDVQVNLPGNANFTAQVAFTAGAISQAQSGVGAVPRTVPANGSAVAFITVLLTDAHGNGIANMPVSLIASGSNNTLVQPMPHQTDAHGVLRATLASTTAELKTVQASGSGFVLTTPVTFITPPAACAGTLGFPQGPRLSSGGTGVRALTAADFNNDGRPDVAVANTTSNTVAVFMNAGHGLFTARPPFAVDGLPTHLVAADLRGDGSAELVVSSDDMGSVEVFDSMGVSQARLTPGGVTALAVGPIDGDADLDLAVSSNGNLLVYPGNAGTFSPSTVVISAAQNSNFVALALGDLDNDTRADVLGAFQDDVFIFRGSGSGTFAFVGKTTQQINSGWLQFADLDADGRIDLLGTKAYALGNGDGTLGQARSYPSNFSLGVQFDVTDYNGDQRLDVAGTSSANGLIVAPGNGDGTFSPMLGLQVGVNAAATVARDFNGDGNTDFAVLDGQLNSFTVALAAGGGFFASPSPTPLATAPTGMALGDWNNDGVTDLLLSTSSATLLFAGQTNGSFAAVTTATSPAAGNASVALGDFDGNGRPDLATVQPGNNTVTVQFNDAPLPFAAATPSVYATGNNPRALATGDLNGDGQADLVVANANDNTVSVLLAGVGGALQPPVTYATHTFPTSVTIARLNADSAPDVVVSNQNSNDVSVLLGSASGALGAAAHFASGPAPSGLVVGDFDSDGKQDVAAFSRASSGGNGGRVTVQRGNGDGTLQAVAATLSAGSAQRSLTVLDLNRDGALDLAWLNGDGSTLRVAYGNNAAAFLAPVVYDTWELGPTLLGSADIDGDGKPDGVVVHTTHPGFTVLTSAGCN